MLLSLDSNAHFSFTSKYAGTVLLDLDKDSQDHQQPSGLQLEHRNAPMHDDCCLILDTAYFFQRPRAAVRWTLVDILAENSFI